jgi:hypothetical protein
MSPARAATPRWFGSPPFDRRSPTLPESKNTPADLKLAAKVVTMKQLVGKLEPHILEVLAMMRSHIIDGLSAMRYGQYGGSTPDPTGNTAGTRDSVAETHLKAMFDHVEAMFDHAEEADRLRRLYMSANNNIRDRLDPTDFCVVHWHLQVYEGHRRFKGPLCKICAGFYDENGREPTPTEADHYHRHGRWPHKRYDPKERRAV